MSPIRHEDDFRRVEIDDWDEWIQEQIQESIERGEFDNLPGAGKPLHIHRTAVNPDYDLAFSRMKNAGVKPAWMELEHQVRKLRAELELFLERSRDWLLSERDAYLASSGQPDEDEERPRIPWWQFWAHLREWFRVDEVVKVRRKPPSSIGEILVLRDHVRRQYLERAAALDKKIAEYHNSLPRELSHLQRLRMLPERAARIFDEQFPERLLLAGPESPVEDQATDEVVQSR